MINIEKRILEHQNIFYFFDEVYLFGSALDESMYSNDIDLLLIYKEYSEQIKIEKQTINFTLEKILKKDIDITILSIVELDQTKFLKRLYSTYKRLK